MMIWRIASAVLLSAQMAGAGCRDIFFEDQPYTVCEVQAGADVRLFHSGPDGAVLGSFSAVDAQLGAKGEALAFAMNGGMYHPDRAPVGLYIEDGVQASALVKGASSGNFGLLPNGVFCISDRFAVIETRAYASAPPVCRFATQSGPMLVIDGALHPRFLADSDSLNIRNGVGVSADGAAAFFVISNGAVNFHSFARLFRDVLQVPNALYFDGSISRLYAPDLGRHDSGFPMGPIVGVVVPKP